MNIKKETVAKGLFYTAFLLILFVDYVSATSIPVIYSGRMFQIAALLLAGKIVLTRYERREWILLFVLAGMGIASFFAVRNYFFFLLVLLLFGAKDISFRKALAIYLIFVSALTLFVGVAAFAGWFGELSQTMDFRAKGIVETRYCMGYTHPNTYHIILLQLLLAAIWFFWKRIKWFHMLLALLLNTVIYFATDSRTNLLLGTGFLLLLLAGKLIKGIQKQKWVYGMGFCVFAGAQILSLLTVLKGTGIGLLNRVNEFWSGRIFWGNIWANNYLYYANGRVSSMSPREQFSLFSGENSQIAIDMGFIRLYYNYGAVIFTAVMVFLLAKLLQNFRKRDWAELIILMAGMVFMLGESFSSGEFFTRNVLFLFLLSLWSSTQDEKEVRQATVGVGEANE